MGTAVNVCGDGYVQAWDDGWDGLQRSPAMPLRAARLPPLTGLISRAAVRLLCPVPALCLRPRTGLRPILNLRHLPFASGTCV